MVAALPGGLRDDAAAREATDGRSNREANSFSVTPVQLREASSNRTSRYSYKR